MRRLRFTLTVWFLLIFACGATFDDVEAQERLQSSVLVIDPERLFAETRFGGELSGALEEASRILAQQNREIEADLVAEERALTSARASMTPEAFRQAAEEFDARVTQLRTEQDSKSQALVAQRDQERQQFLDLVLPVLGGLLADYGAYVFLDSRQVFLSDDRINVTDEAIARIDAALVLRNPDEAKSSEVSSETITRPDAPEAETEAETAPR